MEHFKVLEFDLPTALLKELIALFAQMKSAPLSRSQAAELPEGQGVYQLYHREKLVYVGKTDVDTGLRNRILRHCEKVSSRLGLHPQDVSFKAIRIYVFTAMDLETSLINHYKKLEDGLKWNHSGFGSNDPGRKRDHSTLKDNHFDALYPIDLDLKTQLDPLRGSSAASALIQLKENLPYTIRFQTSSKRSKRPHQHLLDTPIQIPDEPSTVRSILARVSQALGREWQVTALPGYVIIYNESRDYDHGLIL
ncbi:GIY-YIG nuclease family protein [Stenotrophomonas indicatrix]|uniref:GIY-YIG nuclease family protein n=1 Tax=Stenotrophomonas indicatrix TaxID=2045451 RepID=UPI002656B646|nr:GIY-YIG nuclease family protein [Stenotrophomonas indicatrix]MDN8648217.1 GIY-YIG nuclease family protein [Stenotrophomonas indicatrix]